MSLAEHFPESFRADFSIRNRNLSIGKVLRLNVKDTNPPKIKRFIIVGFTEDNVSLASIYINTEINTLINWSKELQDLHLKFESEGREYLDHTSYIDCTKLIERNCEEIKGIIEKRPESVIGEVSDSDFKLIIDKLKESTTIKGKLKKRYGLFDF